MKPNSPFTKVIVVTVFILLISGFVAYRSGAYDKMMAGQQNNNQAIAANTISDYEYDTLPKPDTTTTLPRIMSSSKSMVMTDVEYEYIVKDGKLKRKLKKKNKNKAATDTIKPPPPVMMPSSKSGPMITPRKTTLDTAKHQQ